MHVVKRTTLAREADAGYLLITSCIVSRAVLWQDVALLIPFPKLGIDTNPNTASTGRPLLPIHCRSPLLLVRPAALHPRGDAFYQSFSNQMMMTMVMMRFTCTRQTLCGLYNRSATPPDTKRAAFRLKRKAALATVNSHSQPKAAASPSNGCRKCAWSSSHCAAARPSARPSPRACSRSSP